MREFVRKVLHLSLILLILIDTLSHTLATLLIFSLSLVYLCTELLRRKGKTLPLLTRLVDCCSYPYERNSLLLPPFLLMFSISMLLSFNSKLAYVAIIASTVGDVSAWFVGKFFGKVKLPYNRKKTLEGMLACLFTTLSGSLLFLNFPTAFLVSITASIFESISERVDNVLIPLSVTLVLTIAG